MGQEVIFSKGEDKDVRGVVHTPFWQVSQSEYPEVIIELADGTGVFVDIDDVRPAEDPYEYNLEVPWSSRDNHILYDDWADKELIESMYRQMLEHRMADNIDDVKIVKRKKAGPIEYV